jgi:hypothetical protein
MKPFLGFTMLVVASRQVEAVEQLSSVCKIEAAIRQNKRTFCRIIIDVHLELPQIWPLGSGEVLAGRLELNRRAIFCIYGKYTESQYLCIRKLISPNSATLSRSR